MHRRRVQQSIFFQPPVSRAIRRPSSRRAQSSEWNMTKRDRCAWPGDLPLMIEYHDTEWGTPLHDDRKHYEFLLLDAVQAGLSWRTVLAKRENYRKAFDGFDAAKVARYSERRIAKILQNPGIIRNRLKVESAVTNAQR